MSYHNYTLEKEGYEVENISETKFKIKVDITKKIPLVDFSNTYIEVSDLQDLKKYISGEKEKNGNFNRTNEYTTDSNIINNVSSKNEKTKLIEEDRMVSILC